MKRFTTIFIVTITVMFLTGGLIFGTALAKGLNTVHKASPSVPNSTTRKFHSQGTGTEASLSASGCQFLAAPSGCTVQTNGTASTTIANLTFGSGPYMSVVTVFWSEAYPNPNVSGAYCALASGPSQLVASTGDSLNLVNYGTVCETQASGPSVPHTFNGRFIVAGGTGVYLGAKGSGKFSSGDNGSGSAYYSSNGSVTTTT